MIAALIVYVLAGILVGRMCWEFDVYADEPESEVRMCWMTGATWILLLVYAFWRHLIEPRP